jgi:hypothetical protein
MRNPLAVGAYTMLDPCVLRLVMALGAMQHRQISWCVYEAPRLRVDVNIQSLFDPLAARAAIPTSRGLFPARAARRSAAAARAHVRQPTQVLLVSLSVLDEVVA